MVKVNIHLNILIFVLSIITLCYSQEYLEPSGSIFLYNSYDLKFYTILNDSLLKGINLRYTIAGIVTIPFGEPECILSIQEVHNKVNFPIIPDYQVTRYIIVASIPDSCIGVNSIDNIENKIYRLKSTKINRFKKVISKKDANIIGSVFNKMLLESRYPPEPRYGIDGDNFYFFSRGKCAKIWSPDYNTMTGKLLEISELLFKYIKADKNRDKYLLKEIKSKCLQLMKMT